MSRIHLILDAELIGNNDSGEEPVFLIKAKEHETGKWHTFWMHKRGHMAKFEKLLLEGGHTVVTFNGENFDRPLIAAALAGHDGYDLKTIAQAIIDERMVSWQTYREFGLEFLEYDHIDIMGVPPGVMLSLKTYEGRMHWHNLQDMPYPHDYVLKTPKEFKTVEQYCENDVLSTEALFETVKKDIDLRIELGERYELDLRSKSDAQVAEAILKSVVGIKSGFEKLVPRAVQYTAPVFIETDSPEINALIERLEKTEFLINRNNGSPILPDWMTEPFRLGEGLYKFGLGGLHSQHDIRVCHRTDARTMISDIDAASYYPKIMIEAGLIPTLGGNKGETFLDTYEGFYHERVDAKRGGDKRLAGTLKIVLNGTFGKLGSIYCSFYAPELMLAVTITGQLNLLCLIHEVEKVKGVKVVSANTDGIMIKYPKSRRAALLRAIQGNAKRTGFEYEETPYSKIGIRDVNNYVAITEEREMVIIPPKGKIVRLQAGPPSAKRKGAYAKAGVMENVSPTFQICADACADWLLKGTPLTAKIYACDDIRQFVSIRGVTGGGVQHKKEMEVDDWVCINDLNSAKSEWVRQAWLDDGWEPGTGRASVKRKSRPKPVIVGIGGEPFGRVARWYMTTKKQPAITYVGSGNKVPNTDGAQLCMQLPDKLPKDLDHEWYIAKASEMLADLGVEI